MACSTVAWAKARSSPATTTPSRTSRSGRGRASPSARGSSAREYPNFVRWFDGIAERPAVQRGVEVLADRRRPDYKTDKEAWEIMFGSKQYQRR